MPGRFLKIIFLVFFFSLSLPAQDTTGYYQQAVEQIKAQNYASAHLLLQAGIEEVAEQPVITV